MYNKFYFKLLLVVLVLIPGLVAGCGDESTPLPKVIPANATPTVESVTVSGIGTATPSLPPATFTLTATLPLTATPQPSNTPLPTPTLPATPTAVPETTASLAPTSPSPASTTATVAASAAATKPATTSAKNISDDSSPCTVGQIKGNRNSKIYHTPGQRDYAKTKLNVQCFDTEAEALAAGYRHALR